MASLTVSGPRGAAARIALTGAAAFWWLVAIIGQWAFLYYILALYGASTATGNFAVWRTNKLLFKGYVPGDTAGNLAFAAHALFAGYMAFGGLLHLVPQIRARAPRFHRWNGRIFVLTALGVSLTGLYMVWVRHSNPSLNGSLATTLNGVLIILFAGLAWRTARAGAFDSHRRWALRLFIVASGQWFIRVGVFAWVIAATMLGLKPHMGTFFLFWNFGCFLVPLSFLELYLRAKDGGGGRLRLAVAGTLVVSALLMGIGIAGVSIFLWQAVLSKL